MTATRWPEAHPDVIRTCLPYDPTHLGIRVLRTREEFLEAMAVMPDKQSAEVQEEVDRVAATLDAGAYVVLLEAYPEAYREMLSMLTQSYQIMVPFVAGARRKRAAEN